MKNIKNFFTNKITMVVLACLLLVGVFAGITIVAGNSNPTLELVDINLDHQATPNLIYTVAVNGLTGDDDAKAPELANLSMKFWYEEPASLTDKADDVATADNGRIEPLGWDETKNALIFEFDSISFAPKRMTDTIFASAVLTDAEGNVISQTPVKSYSVYEYLCELNLSGATKDQMALTAAMKEYITYAQDYLGWNDSTSPSDLRYFRAVDATFQISVDSGKSWSTETYTAGTFEKSTQFKITAPDNYARFVNEGGYICDQYDDNYSNYWTVGALSNDRSIIALKGTKVNITTENGAYLQELEVHTVQGAPAYKVLDSDINRFENGEYVVIVENSAKYHKDYAFVAPLRNEAGEILVGWANANGDKVSDDTIYFLTADDIDYSKEEVNVEFKPIYGEEDATLTHDLLSGDGMVLDGATEDNKDSVVYSDKITIARKPIYAEGSETEIIGWTYDCSGRTAVDGNPGATFSNTIADEITTLSKAHVSFKVNIAGKNGGTKGSDYFIAGTNCDLFQNYVQFGGSSPIMFAWRSDIAHNTETDAKYYYINVITNSSNNNAQSYNHTAGRMEYGVDNQIDMFIEFEEIENGYKVAMVRYYVNGNFAGSCGVYCMQNDNDGTFPNANTAGIRSTVLGRCCALVTYKEPTIKLWN